MDYIRKGIKNHIDHWGYEILTCPGCGSRVIPGQKYCSECGRELENMEEYMRGIRKALGHKCKECRSFGNMHCSHPNFYGSRTNELVHNDRNYMRPDADACYLYDGEDDYGDQTGSD